MVSKLITLETSENEDREPSVRYIREILVNYGGRNMEPFVVDSALSVADFVRQVLPDNSREHRVVLYLDRARTVICYAVVFSGDADWCRAHPREIFQRAMLVGANSLVIAHNQTSVDAVPSDQDYVVTQALREIGDMLGIPVVDHVIVAEDSYYSFSDGV